MVSLEDLLEFRDFEKMDTDCFDSFALPKCKHILLFLWFEGRIRSANLVVKLS